MNLLYAGKTIPAFCVGCMQYTEHYARNDYSCKCSVCNAKRPNPWRMNLYESDEYFDAPQQFKDAFELIAD
jgi:hypothetical protein